jgi:hypothetical protein
VIILATRNIKRRENRWKAGTAVATPNKSRPDTARPRERAGKRKEGREKGRHEVDEMRVEIGINCVC